MEFIAELPYWINLVRSVPNEVSEVCAHAFNLHYTTMSIKKPQDYFLVLKIYLCMFKPVVGLGQRESHTHVGGLLPHHSS